MNQIKHHTIKSLFLLLTLIFWVQSNAQTIKKVNGELLKISELEAEVQKIMNQVKMSGLSIAIINDSKLAYHNTFGVVNSETKIKITKDHIFEGASLSKPIFAYFVMKMVDKGLLDLNKPLHDYFPHPAISQSSIEDYKLITAKMILSHSSGFPNFSEGQKINLPFKPGNGFLYSGEGYQYLAAVIGKLNGVGWKDKFNEIFKNQVTKPLSMKHTSFLWNDHLEKHKVYGHENGTPTSNGTGGWSGKTFNAFSSIHSEALEYSKFIITMLKQEGLSQESFTEMLKEQNTFSPSNQLFKETGQTGWGLGFAQKPTAYGTMHLHTGNNHDFQAYTMFIPDQKYGIVLFTNSDKMLPFIQKLNTILGEQF
ncbi:serine hydrolase domain-containing protein [Aquimarina sp. 2201CG5-10]|uniref:serine hydrolase domain-containing protein n=1 Tax=Aquimarina callyspongiae TaxID=3098150 RepID=UPI002AB4AC65|nr:serine hydrolase domain-containing protein [Aquimarina sp. 2201CG5-10]MDY8137678.1 serine hydrolase domain-containing protein [Aquimarina sp. 2201CG5-10]